MPYMYRWPTCKQRQALKRDILNRYACIDHYGQGAIKPVPPVTEVAKPKMTKEQFRTLMQRGECRA